MSRADEIIAEIHEAWTKVHELESKVNAAYKGLAVVLTRLKSEIENLDPVQYHAVDQWFDAMLVEDNVIGEALMSELDEYRKGWRF